MIKEEEEVKKRVPARLLFSWLFFLPREQKRKKSNHESCRNKSAKNSPLSGCGGGRKKKKWGSKEGHTYLCNLVVHFLVYYFSAKWRKNYIIFSRLIPTPILFSRLILTHILFLRLIPTPILFSRLILTPILFLRLFLLPYYFHVLFPLPYYFYVIFLLLPYYFYVFLTSKVAETAEVIPTISSVLPYPQTIRDECTWPMVTRTICVDRD